jgi:hypothetical protein
MSTNKRYIEIACGPTHSATVELVRFGGSSNRPRSHGHSLLFGTRDCRCGQ